MRSPPRRRASAKDLGRLSSGRTRLDVEQRRAQLLALGLRLFAGRSYDEISIDELAAAAGVSKGLLYHYFSSKRSFYVACVRMSAEQLIERLDTADSLDPAERLRQGLSAYLDLIEEHGRSYVAFLRGGIGTDEEVAAITENIRAVVLQRLVKGLGAESVPPQVRNALRGWMGYVEAVTLDWAEWQDVDRGMLLESIMCVLEAAVLWAAK